MFLKTKLSKTYNLIIKTVIIILAYGFIYNQIFHKRDFSEITGNFAELFQSNGFVLKLSFIFVLMFINWGIESWKWKYLIKKIENISFVKSFKAVLAGITVSTLTPNRVGEYFGRVFILDKANPWEGVFITIIGSMSQLLITIIVGSVSLLFFISSNFDVYYYLLWGIIIIVLVLNIFLLLLFLNVSLITSFVNRFVKEKWRRIRKYMRIFSFYSSKELLKVLLFSFLRYLVFSFQFYLLLRLFNVNILFKESLIIIPIIFFIITAIPTIALSELGIRGSVAIYFIGMYIEKTSVLTDQINIGIISATSVLWLINLVIPALIGSAFVFNLNFFKKRS